MSIAEKLTTIAENEQKVFEAGYDEGKQEGYGEGQLDGYNNGYDTGVIDGRQAERDEFWDIFQQNGARTSYENVFKDAFWGANFKPKYDLNVKYGTYMFYGFGGMAYTTTGVTYDLTAILEECGVTLNTANCANLSYFYSYSSFSRVPTTNATADTKGLTYLAANCRKLVTFDKLILREDGSNTFNNSFLQCVNLKNIVIEGTIGENFDVQHSPLTAESAISIIEHLKNYSGTDKEYTYKVTFSSTTKSNLNALGNTAPDGLTWLDYATYGLGWNV